MASQYLMALWLLKFTNAILPMLVNISVLLLMRWEAVHVRPLYPSKVGSPCSRRSSSSELLRKYWQSNIIMLLTEPPTFTKTIENSVIVLGKMAEFQCVVTGSPTFSVQWQKDDSWIMEDPKMERTFENNVATLRIPACEAMHSGRYTCQVSNEAGQDKCSASLIVQGNLCFAITVYSWQAMKNVINCWLCFEL